MTPGKVQHEIMDAAKNSPQTLIDYTRQLRADHTPRTPRQKRRFAIKAAAIGTVVAGVFCVGVFSGKAAREHAPRFLGPGAAVASHELSPSIVVYEELPSAARDLLVDTAYINPLAHQRPVAVHSSRQTRHTYQMLTRSETVNTASDHGAQALLTELRTINGQSRIVSVRYIPAGTNAQVAGFLIETFDLSGFFARPKRVYQAFIADVVNALPTDQSGARDFRLFAGEVESDEAGHFTIPYEVGNQRGIIDGYLRPDGRTVDLQLREDTIRRMLETNPVHMQVEHRQSAWLP
ncbi:MAG: hypothetical protein AAGD32_18065 [Planctomycetota bacterium]